MQNSTTHLSRHIYECIHLPKLGVNAGIHSPWPQKRTRWYTIPTKSFYVLSLLLSLFVYRGCSNNNRTHILPQKQCTQVLQFSNILPCWTCRLTPTVPVHRSTTRSPEFHTSGISGKQQININYNGAWYLQIKTPFQSPVFSLYAVQGKLKQ